MSFPDIFFAFLFGLYVFIRLYLQQRIKNTATMKKYFAELIGTMILVLAGCGSAIFLGCDVNAPATILSVALAFGLSVVAMAYCIGGISGCHINPAITLAVWLSRRMSGKDAIGYMISQFAGAVAGSAILYALTATGGYGANTATGANAFGIC